ncbi:programmed cell death protein 2-like isoform X2 [Seriola lalandi dorsalis]|uniref:programmed cell death protein 2-like isoform X2 n=1 Tax=Seriola lalandi dorsalis TaxID=1841481 RepID=UPI000C6F95BC|nr:programmed cell death protein 2-like isoform X2 [Seriola lalandi dorsalis]
MASPTQESNLIGVADGELDPKRYQSSFLINKVGGQPDWLPVISRQSPRCGRCGAPLAHVAQVYCPLDASPYHRNLHLLACLGAECSGRSEGWRVLRSQCLETEVAAAQTPSRPAPPQEAPLSATDWCDTADDWGMEEEEEGGDGWGGGVKKDTQVNEEAAAPEAEGRPVPSEMDVSSRLQDLTLGESHEDVPVFRPFFISVVEESDLCGEEDDLEHAQELLREYESREGAVGLRVGEVEGGEEKYEKTSARHGDAVFSRFMKKISLCPQQILRYCHKGNPRFISEPPSNMAQVVSACGSCGGPRTFELQLMPALVSLLQRKDGGAEAELEFGTVLVYTCAKSCWTAGSGSAVEEFCFVQGDPDQQLFK